MQLLEAIILGLLQGIFEWLPVSSEAVISVFMTQVLGTEVVSSVNTAIWLHTGTMFAALIYFRGDFLELTKLFFSKLRSFDTDFSGETDKMLFFIFFSTFFTGLFGGSLYLLGIKSLANRPDIFAGLTALALLFTGLARLYTKESSRRIKDLAVSDSVLIGLLQGLAVLPGISRSGSTVFGLLFRDFSGEDAFKLSFLMSVPAVFIANIGINIFSGFSLTIPLVLAALVSFIVGYLTIDLVLELAGRAEIAYLCFVLALISFLPIII